MGTKLHGHKAQILEYSEEYTFSINIFYFWTKLLKIIPLHSEFRKCTLYAHALATSVTEGKSSQESFSYFALASSSFFNPPS